MIDKSTIDTIFSVARVEEVIGDFVNLKKRGANYIGSCPFHNERTPSFMVSPAKGIYKCFGCGKAGNAVNFIMEHEKYSYPEALKYIANKYNIQVEEKERTPEEQLEDDLRERLFNINNFAQDYFSNILLTDKEGIDIGLSYFEERGFNANTIKLFKLGYSPDKFTAFYDYAISKGYKKDILKDSGLISITESNKIIDKFRGRVIFPIHNLTGRVIGFGGRIMDSDKKAAKYLNSPETAIYNKSASLYGVYFAKSEIVSSDFCYLVEGYTDVITMYQSGIHNVVASSGTSLTSQQIRLIKRYTKNITVIYDGDFAGIKASLRGIDMILEEGMNVKIIPLPDGEDPDSFVRNNSTSEVKDYFKNNEQDFIKFKTSLLLDEIGNDPIKKVQVIKDIVDSIALIPDIITRSVYIKECANSLDMKEQTLLFEMNKVIAKNKKEKNKQKDNTPEHQEIVESIIENKPESQDYIGLFENSFDFLERSIIEKLIKYGDKMITIDNDDDSESPEEKILVGSYIIHEIMDDNIVFTNDTYQEILNLYSSELSEGRIPTEKFFINNSNNNISQTCINIIATRYSISENWEKVYEITVLDESWNIKNTVFRSIYSYKAAYIKKLRINIQNELKNTTDELKVIELLKLDQKYKSVEMAINKILDRVIT